MKDFNVEIKQNILQASIITEEIDQPILIIENNNTYNKVLADSVEEVQNDIVTHSLMSALSNDNLALDSSNFISAGTYSGYDIIESVETIYNCYRSQYGLDCKERSEIDLTLKSEVYKVDIEYYTENPNLQIQTNLEVYDLPIGYNTITIPNTSNSFYITVGGEAYIKSFKFYIKQNPVYKYTFKYPVTKDGVYTTYITIPKSPYYIENGILKKTTGDFKEDILLKELVVIESIEKVSKTLVHIANMFKCYINYCNQIFKTRTETNCFASNFLTAEVIYKRDLVWMAINVIKYLTESELYSEVSRIIASIEGCNGLCINTSSKYNGCGCSK